MVGYAILNTTAKASRSSGTFRRRVFWLLPHDRDTDPDGLYATGAPAEAVDPRTLAPATADERPNGLRAARPQTLCKNWEYRCRCKQAGQWGHPGRSSPR
jgi:hypothetical protein